jgi:hypothetical protein
MLRNVEKTVGADVDPGIVNLYVSSRRPLVAR